MTTKLITWTAYAPYDGCHWEYNYAIGFKGKLYPVYVSGINDDKDSLKEGISSMILDESNKIEIVDISNEANCREIEKELPYNSIPALLKAIEDNNIKCRIWFNCESCGTEIVDPEEVAFNGYTGNGGIGVSFTGIECMECYNIHCCAYCNEYYTDGEWDELVKRFSEFYGRLEELGLYVENFCSFCTFDQIEEKIKHNTPGKLTFGNFDQIKAMKTLNELDKIMEEMQEPVWN